MATADADLIIAGGGCAGLSALWAVLHSGARARRVLVIDTSTEPRDERTWAFWGPRTAPFADLADRRWRQLQVRFPGWQRTDRLGLGSRSSAGRTYARVRQRDYESAILAAAAAHSNVRFLHQPIVDIRDERDGGMVVLPEGELRAPLVLQSIRLDPDASAAPVRHPLRQHFGGLEVRTERPVFDPAVATLMDFDTHQLGATAFFYVLPEARDRALVEHTVFSTSVESAEFHFDRVRGHLERMGAGEVSIERVQYGVIPMEDRTISQQAGRHVRNIGTVGGMTKPTTGYTFQRIHRQTHHLVERWAAGAPITPLAAAPRRFAAADRVLLSILHHRPELGRPIFEQLFRSTPLDDVLTFLDEESTVRRDATMMAHLRPWPFLRAAAGEVAALGRHSAAGLARSPHVA